MKQLTTSEQARADAMADAETLLRFAAELPLTWDSTRHQKFAGAAWTYQVPGVTGNLVASDLRQNYYPRASSLARDAARAAFRAVPGLRGE